MSVSNEVIAGAAAPPFQCQTTVALFDDTIDAEEALVALRKTNRPAEQISLILRERDGSPADASGRQSALAQAMAALALDTVGGWLRGLASIIVPDRGTYLVAGPLGARLIASHADRSDRSPSASEKAPIAPAASGMGSTLTEFGFGSDEAAYIEHRVIAGSPLIAVTSSDALFVRAARALLARRHAVHVGLASTDDEVAADAARLLAAGPANAATATAVVADAIAPLHRLTEITTAAGSLTLRGQPVVDPDGETAGAIEEVLAEMTVDPDTGRHRTALRYLILSFGGLLGLKRHHAAVPVELVDLESEPLRVTIPRDALHQAPRFDADLPFSRREEVIIRGYFGIEPYWATADD